MLLAIPLNLSTPFRLQVIGLSVGHVRAAGTYFQQGFHLAPVAGNYILRQAFLVAADRGGKPHHLTAYTHGPLAPQCGIGPDSGAETSPGHEQIGNASAVQAA